MQEALGRAPRLYLSADLPHWGGWWGVGGSPGRDQAGWAGEGGGFRAGSLVVPQAKDAWLHTVSMRDDDFWSFLPVFGPPNSIEPIFLVWWPLRQTSLGYLPC